MSRKELKIAVAGDTRTGKTCLVNRFVENIFSDQYKMTIGAEFKTKSVEIDGTQVTLQIWDIAGQFITNHAVTRNFFKDASGVIVSFSLAGIDSSMTSLSEWRNRSLSAVDDDVPCVLVGTKCDLGKLEQKSIEAICQVNNFHKWYQTSSKTGEGVNEMFEDLTRQMMDYQLLKEELSKSHSTIDLKNANSRNRKHPFCSGC